MKSLIFAAAMLIVNFGAVQAQNVPPNLDAVSAFLTNQGLKGLNLGIIREPAGIYCGGNLQYMGVIVPSGESVPSILCKDRFHAWQRNFDVFARGTSVDQALDFARKHLARWYTGHPIDIGRATPGQCTPLGATARYCPVRMDGMEFHFFVAAIGEFIVIYGDEGPRPSDQSTVANEFSALVKDASAH